MDELPQWCQILLDDHFPFVRSSRFMQRDSEARPLESLEVYAGKGNLTGQIRRAPWLQSLERMLDLLLVSCGSDLVILDSAADVFLCGM
jgi:hypothetical protein